MRWGGATATPRLRVVVAVMAAVWLAGWLLVIGAHHATGHSDSPVQPAQVSLMSSHGGFAATMDLPHFDKGSSAHPERLMTAVMPRSATALDALVVLGVVAAVAVGGWLAGLGVPAGRGPPRGPAVFLTGQDVLTRFCLSRR
ncbi:hypothetical protein [Mycobacterium kubicae]|uniref:hypothetical protein n=1 Tax=Mycobacterium kubicae TaxID=120959 RepID=UPI00163F367E|nr:hypothetical protein [Mycobacterium kubicae]